MVPTSQLWKLLGAFSLHSGATSYAANTLKAHVRTGHPSCSSSLVGTSGLGGQPCRLLRETCPELSTGTELLQQGKALGTLPQVAAGKWAARGPTFPSLRTDGRRATSEALPHPQPTPAQGRTTAKRPLSAAGTNTTDSDPKQVMAPSPCSQAAKPPAPPSTDQAPSEAPPWSLAATQGPGPPIC